MKEQGENYTKTAKKRAPKEVSSMTATYRGLDVMLRRSKIGARIEISSVTCKNRKSFGKSRIIYVEQQ
jgi:hypothetical protein